MEQNIGSPASPGNGGTENTDRDLWRGPADKNDMVHERIFVTQGGGIGIEAGGSVIVMPLARWHAAARGEMGLKTEKPLRMCHCGSWCMARVFGPSRHRACRAKAQAHPSPAEGGPSKPQEPQP